MFCQWICEREIVFRLLKILQIEPVNFKLSQVLPCCFSDMAGKKIRKKQLLSCEFWGLRDSKRGVSLPILQIFQPVTFSKTRIAQMFLVNFEKSFNLTQAKVFSCEFYKFFKNSYFADYVWGAASIDTIIAKFFRWNVH